MIVFFFRYYLWLVPLVTFLIPSYIPYWLWQERFWYSFVVVGVTRYMVSLHFTWLVNSAAHIWGTKPYDKLVWLIINSINNLAPIITLLLSVVIYRYFIHLICKFKTWNKYLMRRTDFKTTGYIILKWYNYEY